MEYKFDSNIMDRERVQIDGRPKIKTNKAVKSARSPNFDPQRKVLIAKITRKECKREGFVLTFCFFPNF